jgi:hypothetical protein
MFEIKNFYESLHENVIENCVRVVIFTTSRNALAKTQPNINNCILTSPEVKTHSASSAVLQRRSVTTDALPENNTPAGATIRQKSNIGYTYLQVFY